MSFSATPVILNRYGIRDLADLENENAEARRLRRPIGGLSPSARVPYHQAVFSCLISFARDEGIRRHLLRATRPGPAATSF